MKRAKVRDVMTRTVHRVRGDTAFKQIVRVMDRYKVDALPVVDEDDHVIGIVSQADLLFKEEEPERERHLFEGKRTRKEHEKARGETAAEIMTTPVITVEPDASVAQAARLIRENNVKRLPVLDENGVLIGIVSRVDLLSVFLRTDEDIRYDVIHDVFEKALWMDPRDVDVRVASGVVTMRGKVETRSLVEIVTGLVHGIPGVVGIDNQLSFEFDDVHAGRTPVVPWGVLPESLRRP